MLSSALLKWNTEEIEVLDKYFHCDEKDEKVMNIVLSGVCGNLQTTLLLENKLEELLK